MSGSRRCAKRRRELKGLLDEVGIRGWPKTTGNRGIHVYTRLEPRWTPIEVRRAAVAVARELARRRPDAITDAWWKEERGDRVFVDFNQNAPHKTVFGAWSIRARAAAEVSTPFHWDELDDIDPEACTVLTVPDRVEARGDPWADIADDPQVLTPFLEMYDRDIESGLEGRAVAAGVPEDARRAAAGRAEPGPQGRRRQSDHPAAAEEAHDAAARSEARRVTWRVS